MTHLFSLASSPLTISPPLLSPQWCSRDSNLRDRDLVKTLRPRSRNSSKTPIPRRETLKFVHFDKIKKMSSSLLTWMFFTFLVLSRHVLVVSYLQIQQTKNHWKKPILTNQFFAIFKVSRQRPRLVLKSSRPRLEKMDLKTSLETETKSRDSITLAPFSK